MEKRKTLVPQGFCAFFGRHLVDLASGPGNGQREFLAIVFPADGETDRKKAAGRQGALTPQTEFTAAASAFQTSANRGAILTTRNKNGRCGAEAPQRPGPPAYSGQKTHSALSRAQLRGGTAAETPSPSDEVHTPAQTVLSRKPGRLTGTPAFTAVCLPAVQPERRRLCGAVPAHPPHSPTPALLSALPLLYSVRMGLCCAL